MISGHKRKKKQSIFVKPPKVKMVFNGNHVRRQQTENWKEEAKENMWCSQWAKDRQIYHLQHRLLSTLKIAL